MPPMRRRSGPAAVLAAMASAFTAAAAGCAAANPWMFKEPPAVGADPGFETPHPRGTTSIAVAQFANPAVSPLGWSNIGQGMSDALRRALLNETDLEVRSAAPPEPSGKGARPGASATAGADYIVAGRVTDFNHTSSLARELRRWGLIGRRIDAVAAIEFRIIDARRNTVVAADHVYGSSGADRNDLRKQYDNLDFNSYLFWSTPLGRASHEAIERTVDRISALLPGHSGDPTIAAVTDDRQVSLKGGQLMGVAPGQDYFVYTESSTPGGSPAPLYDPQTELPLVVRIDRVWKDASTGWLRGQPPPGVDLRGAFLWPHSPGPQRAGARRGKGAAAEASANAAGGAATAATPGVAGAAGAAGAGAGAASASDQAAVPADRGQGALGSAAPVTTGGKSPKK